MSSISWRLLTATVLLAGAGLAQKYNGPQPPKPDVPYLLHASRLVETETNEAREEKRKDESVYVVKGTASQARTPLAEPVFILRSEKLMPEKIELYALQVKSGNREIVFPEKKKKDGPRPLHVLVTKLGDGLFKIEVNESLENGEYSLTPAGSNQVFCFQVY